MVGSIALLLAFLALFLATGTFDFLKLAELARTKALGPAVDAKFAWLGLGAGKAYLLLFVGALLGSARRSSITSSRGAPGTLWR